MQRVTVNFFCLKISNRVETLYMKIDQYHFISSGILNVQRLFRCRDDWYQWGGSGGSGLAPGLPQRVTWNEGVHQSITNCCRAQCVKSVIDLKLVIIPSGIPVCLLCTLLHIKTEVLSRNSSY